MNRYRADQIIDVVCRVSGIGLDEIVGTSRHARVTEARGVLITLLRRHTALSYPELARMLKRKHHSSWHGAEMRFARLPEHKTILAPYVAALSGVEPSGHTETLEERMTRMEAAVAGVIRMLADIPTRRSKSVAREEAA